MKLRWKIGLGIAVLIIVCAIWLTAHSNPALRDLEQTRRSLRQQGFKLELKEFDLSLPPEVGRRAAILATTTYAELTNRARPERLRLEPIPPLTTAGTDAALVLWKQEELKDYRGDDFWVKWREQLEQNRASLDACVQAAISGPIRFTPIGYPRPSPLLPYLADLRSLLNTIDARVILALHDGQCDVAWTNLLASTCLATAYAPEPIEVSQLVRCGLVSLAYEATWNALQANCWKEDLLAELQRRWESLDLWSGLSETAAFSRADSTELCQMYRQQPLQWGMTLNEALHHPAYVWQALLAQLREISFRHKGSYEEEKALMLYYRDRELELRRAVLCPTWLEMRGLPGATNRAPFVSNAPSRLSAMLNLRQMSLAFQGRGVGLPGRAAEAEARRRLIVTAIALERYRLRRGELPNSLDKLVPDLLGTAPVDFMDGKPLRYRLAKGGTFVLYSVGLDCADNGGRMRQQRSSLANLGGENLEFGPGQGTDLVWPRPASDAETRHVRQEEQVSRALSLSQNEDAAAAAEWADTSRRQLQAEAILRKPAPPMTNVPLYRGRPLADLLAQGGGAGTNHLSIPEMLALHQITTGQEPETITFELPISYDVLTNFGEVGLGIDCAMKEDSDEGCAAIQAECVRSPAGNARLVWSTLYEAPGKHAVQAILAMTDAEKGGQEIAGPPLPFVITNLCQFSLSSAHFERESGVRLLARLQESISAYTIEIKSTGGQLVKTLRGTTKDGLLKESWDLKDEQGHTCTNNEFDTVFHINLPDSGRSQTLRGP